MVEKVSPLPEKETAQEIKKSLNYSIKDGSFWSIMQGFGESYLSAFAVFLKATSFELAMVVALPQLLSAVFQLAAVKLTTVFKSRKTIVGIFTFLQAVTWLVIIGLTYVFNSVWLLILLSSIYFLLNAMAAPAWTSWMGDLVPVDIRGRYFGRRNRITGFINFASVSIAGIILDRLSAINTLYGFFLLFFIAFLGRLVSWYYLMLQFEPRVELREPKGEGFFKFLKELNTTNFGIFTSYVMLIYFSVYLASPLFVIFWLSYLKFTYLQYTVLIATSAIVTFVTMTYWGGYADKYGNRTVLWVCGNFIGLIPLITFFSWYMPKALQFPAAILVQIISGFGWAGFNLSSSNFLYDAVAPEHRVRYFSYMSSLKGIFLFMGGLIGGILADIEFNGWFKAIIPSGILLVMLMSFFLRTILSTFYIGKIKDVKITEEHKPKLLFFVTIMPLQGLMFDTVVGLNRTLKQFRKQINRIEGKLDYLEEDYRKKTNQ